MSNAGYMNTEMRAKLRRAAPLLGEPGASVALSLMDQVDALESRLAEAEKLLERACKYVSACDTDGSNEWLADLAKWRETK